VTDVVVVVVVGVISVCFDIGGRIVRFNEIIGGFASSYVNEFVFAEYHVFDGVDFWIIHTIDAS